MRSDLFHSNKKNLGGVCGVKSDVFTLSFLYLTKSRNKTTYMLTEMNLKKA